jgi:hypothetical protein
MNYSVAVNPLANQIDLFFGEANPAVARVYLRLRPPFPADASAAGISLSARLIGPFCDFAETLPLKVPFVQLRSESKSSALVAEAIMPDPNFWTPELPFLYRAEINVRRGEEVLFTQKRFLAIRRLGVRGRFLSFEGKRFVVRGLHLADRTVILEDDAAFLRESWTAMVAENPTDEFCEFASRNGIVLIADLTSLPPGRESIAAQLHRLARWPAVGIVALTHDCEFTKTDRGPTPNLIFAEAFVPGVQFELADWADLAFVKIGDSQGFADQTAGAETPVIAVRRRKDNQSIEAARACCDELQYDLARFDDYAGYIV